MSAPASRPAAWDEVSDRLRARGLRSTAQRRAVIEALAIADGHVTGAELVERCRRVDPTTTPSTVYRTLDVLEELGLVRHLHGADGREEYHVLPTQQHGHLYCASCGSTIEIDAPRAAEIESAVRRADGFEVEIDHVTLVGRCRECASRD
ncbi:MAG TPA: Fur family transcriptional regulator [Candidatus Limnocylindria bacterium]|nr:Fur family transcriptional regulator [Candidatus Limnocylindria bacterium]